MDIDGEGVTMEVEAVVMEPLGGGVGATADKLTDLSLQVKF